MAYGGQMAYGLNGVPNLNDFKLLKNAPVAHLMMIIILMLSLFS